MPYPSQFNRNNGLARLIGTLLALLLWAVLLPIQAATLNVARPGSGVGTVGSTPPGIDCGADCTGSYGTGASVNLTATAGATAAFAGWSVGACAGQSSTCALTMGATDQTVAAYFSGATVVGGASHSVALTRDGTVWAWGNNVAGQLGNGTTTSSLVPVHVSGLSNVIAIAAGDYHNVALKNDGTVWTWGRNGFGQLGDGTQIDNPVPVQVSGLSGVLAIAAGSEHSLALKTDGTVWAWGYNGNGQLGNGTRDYKLTPVQVSSLSDVIAIAAGYTHTIAIKSNGTVWSWGGNGEGQLGDGTTNESLIPVQVSSLGNVIAIAAGYYHTVALKSDGTVWTWGYNFFGQLGNGTEVDSLIPVAVSGLSGVTAIAAGDWHSIALKSNGTVWTWGRNLDGQLGNNTTTKSLIPVQVSSLTGAIAIAGGDYHSLALRSDGTIRAWGRNLDGQLGNNTTTNSLIPVQTLGAEGNGIFNVLDYLLAVSKTGTGSGTVSSSPAGINCGLDCSQRYTPGASVTLTATAISGAAFAGWSGACSGTGTCTVTMSAAKNVTASFNRSNLVIGIARPGSGSGTVSSTPAGLNCGATCTGTYGLSTAVTLTATAGTASSFVRWMGGNCSGTSSPCNIPAGAADQTVAAYFAGASVATGYGHSVALTRDGMVWAWGDNEFGQLGNGTTTDSRIPVRVSGLSGVIAIAAGGYHSIALKSDGTVWTWGQNWDGQLGSGAWTDNSLIPVQVSGLTGVVEIAAGGYYSLALKSDGTLWAWGDNEFGQLGNNDTTDNNIPVQVSGLTGVITISAGDHHSVALKSNGTVWTWGKNWLGQLGSGTLNDSLIPVPVSGLSRVIAIAAGSAHTLALKSDGTVWAWGDNGYGQLGNGTTSYDPNPVPVPVSSLTGVIAIAAGNAHSIALKSNGTVWAWGSNQYGQLGNNTTTDSKTPVQVSNLTGVLAIAAGGDHTAAIKNSNSNSFVWAWGFNGDGELGNNTVINSKIPVQTLGAGGTGFLDLHQASYVLTVSKTGTGSGTVASSPAGISCGSDCSELYLEGASVTLTATAASGSAFAGWSGACTSTTSTCTVSMSAARSVTASFSPALASRQINIATRGWAGTGDSVMIAGFVISGTQPKKVLITAKGPVLATAGVPSVLADPNLTLYNSAGQQIQFNENWQSASNASEVAALGRGMNSSYPTEAALLTTLNPGAYTAIVRGAGTTTGNALVEVFDEDSSSTSKLINIATRGWAGTGDSVMIAGFVISGTQPKKVLITAKGPVLATAGVPSVLADPNLTLYNSAGQQIQFNENWQSASNASAVAALGRGMRTDFPQEAALLTTLAPGAYTAIVRGAGSSTGNALVEVFDQD